MIFSPASMTAHTTKLRYLDLLFPSKRKSIIPNFILKSGGTIPWRADDPAFATTPASPALRYSEVSGPIWLYRL